MLTVWGLTASRVQQNGWSYAQGHFLAASLGAVLILAGVFALQGARTPAARKTAIQWHQLLIGCLGLPLLTYGASVMYNVHSLPGRTHFPTWHSTLGGLILCVLWVQVIGGAAVVYGKKTLFSSAQQVQTVRRLHRYVAYIYPALVDTLSAA